MENKQSRLTKPFKHGSVLHISQGFHSKHPGLDIVAKYGTPLVAPENCKVIGLWGDEFTPDDLSNLERGYGLKLKGVTSGYTHLYWHTNPVFPVSMGDIVTRGQIVAFMGNAGNVFANGTYVPLSERHVPPHRGTHLHQEVRSGNNGAVDPNPLIDWSTEPTFGISEWISAWVTVLGKMSKLISPK